MSYLEKAKRAADLADAFKPYEETPERAAIEASLAVAYALIAQVEEQRAQHSEVELMAAMLGMERKE